MQKLSRRDEAVGMLGGEDDGINDPNDMIALLYRKSRLQRELLEPDLADIAMGRRGRYLEEFQSYQTRIKAAIDALDVELLKNFVPLLQRKIVEETETGVLLTLSAEERAALQVAALTHRVPPAAPPADPGQPMYR